MTAAATAAETDPRSASHMAAMLAHIQHGIVLWDRESRIVMANAIAPQLLHMPPASFAPGQSLAQVVADCARLGVLGRGEEAESCARALLERDRTQPFRELWTTRHGRVLESRSAPIPEGGFVTTYTDVTATVAAEDALRLSKTAAEAANAAKSRFLAAMSTELRSPLHTILRESDGIGREASSHAARAANRAVPPSPMNAAAIAEGSEAIATAARTLLGLIDTILDVARLESGRFDLAADTIEIPQLLRHCLRQHDAAAAAAEIALVVDLPESLPLLRGDERRLRQVVGHVIGNALACTDAMGSVSLTARHDWISGDMLLEIHASGDGLNPEDLERAFEPFVPSPNGNPGAGLGLYVSRILMRAHGGDLTLRSTPDAGVTATLSFPANRLIHDSPPET